MAELLPFPKILFDFGAVQSLGAELEALNIKRPLLITDKGLVEHGVFKKVTDALPRDVEYATYDEIPANPTMAGVEGAAEVYKAKGCDGIVGVGGGSVLDSGKAARVAATHPEPLRYYLEDGSRITGITPPYITIPTTAGTGAEVTFGGGIHPEPAMRTLPIRSIYVKPNTAICDPELTFTLPPQLTAATGMDAFGHCLEGYVSSRDDPPGAASALDAIKRVVTYIERAYKDGTDREARWHMLMAAMQGGMAIYKGLGAVHALANTFADGDLHHGAVVTVCAPTVVRFYEGRVDKLADVSAAMGQKGKPDVAAGIEQLNARLGLPKTLREMGYTKTDLDDMAADAVKSHFNLTAPVAPDQDEYRQIIADVLG